MTTATFTGTAMKIHISVVDPASSTLSGYINDTTFFQGDILGDRWNYESRRWGWNQIRSPWLGIDSTATYLRLREVYSLRKGSDAQKQYHVSLKNGVMRVSRGGQETVLYRDTHNGRFRSRI
ncbi:hypothetical protein B0I72DRAFT_133338 [Yarrowia lipolytica]|jgi:hypothetical protein|uniref:YALI0B16148p n=2 Tax=Yarrowia lipolytica TaxID=4952 RepID=Q6CEF1_YARLI|nr:YALI0B16148p [Yarrowia lipolytica CLIB122]AOW01780.1 hypothetical protein YALI1_B21104g [Yarrowia lipolytica]KAB8285017.1 hypothetical protein BKA91DRAFT_134205 [Yarrowia lipolytica]KAE8175059.1 hypothetical protein BKA90DRAFT_132814 [Yarrowia lipolytica]KAJ8052573.1 hypothetical protein LXG23DRAFT_38615 [Yarrowia lipolytica]RDW28388.1 hypothetical protein B0I71DRAFT_127493 [Yarrowia lipolytica]|eukprot:XP_500961.2 YALI0B16148p [Yarrowia lipolytica CLIB122]